MNFELDVKCLLSVSCSGISWSVKPRTTDCASEWGKPQLVLYCCCHLIRRILYCMNELIQEEEENALNNYTVYSLDTEEKREAKRLRM